MTHICLIDDDQNILASLSLALKSEGYIINTFSDGLSGLNSLQEDNYDIAILDIITQIQQFFYFCYIFQYFLQTDNIYYRI